MTNLMKKWYSENVIKNYRDVLLKYPVVESYANKELKKARRLYICQK